MIDNHTGPKRMNDLLNGLPAWAKLSPIAIVHFVLIFLLAQSAGWVPSVSDATSTMIKAHIESTKARSQVVDVMLQQRERKIDELLVRLTTGLRIICVNSARSDNERRNCDNIK